MASLLPTYEYQDDHVIAVFEGRVIASGIDFAKVSCTAEEYLNGLRQERQHKAREEERRTATHITTPNGLKGTVISRVQGLWGDEITVRFENNQIRKFETAAGDDTLVYSSEQPEAPKGYRDYFKQRLDAVVEPTRPGLTARLQDLDGIRIEASRLAASTAAVTEQQMLHQVVLATEAEKAEIQEALDHLAAVDAENAAPAAPVYAAVEQADMGRAKGDSWLDVVAHEMIAESEGVDYDNLMAEGPTQLVSAMDYVHDAGAVREAALAFVTTKTAGFKGEKVEAYREDFIAAAELARRRELSYRQENTAKEAAVKVASQDSIPDEGLFL